MRHKRPVLGAWRAGRGSRRTDDTGRYPGCARRVGRTRGVLVLYEDGRCYIDMLDEMAARAALDAVAPLILEDHMRSIRQAVERDDGRLDDELALTAVMRR